MTIIEAIEQRRSVRTYTGEPLKREDLENIAGYIAGLKAPFGVKARIELIHNRTGTEKIKLGTYGYISGASNYLALLFEKGTLAEEGAACMFEQAILFCTQLGLGTCWLGGSFSRKNFTAQLDMKANEELQIVSPVGYSHEKRRWVEVVIGAKGNHASRKPFEATFFDRNFETPLAAEAAGIYRKPLEMVRLAPSANNQQSWRIIKDGNSLHFYRHLSLIKFSAIDLGIALCHFEQTCSELAIPGRFEIFKDGITESKSNKYSVSWVAN